MLFSSNYKSRADSHSLWRWSFGNGLDVKLTFMFSFLALECFPSRVATDHMES